MRATQPNPEGNPDAAALWDARSEVDIALLIMRYLTEIAAPPDAVLADQWEEWADRLLRHGRGRLAVLGHPPLRAV